MNTETSKAGNKESSWFQRVDNVVQRIEGWGIFILLSLLVGMTFLQVVLRNIPGMDSYVWLDTLSRWLVLWVGLLGASLAVAWEKHISIDVISRSLPEKPRRILLSVVGLVSLIIVTGLVYGAVGYTLVNHQGEPIPILALEFLGEAANGRSRGIYDYSFTDLVPLFFLLILWHSWVRWVGVLGKAPWARIFGYVVGAALIVSTVGLIMGAFSETQEGGLVNFFVGSVGKLLVAYPMTLILISLALAMMGAPLYLVLSAVALIGLYALQDVPILNFFPDPVGNIRKSPIFLAIPLFTMAGYLMAEGKTAQRLVGLFRGFLGWLPGGVAIVALVACSFFTAFTGASGVTIIALGGLLFPILLEDKYPEKFALGLLTTGGSRGLIFPPSIPVFLLAMIMGLNWDAATKDVPFGSAVQPAEKQATACRLKIAEARGVVEQAERYAGQDQALENAADAVLDAKLKALEEGRDPSTVTASDDDFELGDDGDFGEEPGDDFELGEDDSFAKEEEPADDFELGDDDSFAAKTDEAKDEFELGEDGNFASGDTATDQDPEDAPVAVALVDDEGRPSQGARPPVLDGPAPVEEARIEAPGPADVFLAGLVPGLLLVLAIAIFSIFMGFKSGVVRTRFRLPDAGKALLNARWELPIPILIGVGIFGGFFTPAEAASVTAAYTLLMQLVLYRDFGFATLKKAMVDSVVLVGGILIILMAASGLLNFLVDAKVPDLVLGFIENIVPEQLSVFGLFDIPRQITFLLMLNVFLLVVGCMMDIFSAILVVLPLLLPISYRFGIHPLHLAVIFITNLEIGYSTPPVGINLFVASLRFNRPVTKLYSASLAFLAIMLVGLLLITYWPALSLWAVGS